LWFIRSDIELRYDTCWYGKTEKIDGFKFYSKRPLSKSYQFHSTIGLEYTYPIYSLIQDGIKHKRKAVAIEVGLGFGYETIYIWKGSFKKAEEQMSQMIKKIQQQY
jgi:Xanthosine triphosphate pyrophosphatase